jgi:hypothetical protein
MGSHTPYVPHWLSIFLTDVSRKQINEVNRSTNTTLITTIMSYEITSKKQYHDTMVAIHKLMKKGEANLSTKEVKLLSAMTVAAEKYEDEVLGLKPQKAPETIT